MSDFRVLIIANSLAPYGKEAAKVLSLPVDSKFRARFPEKYVAQDIQTGLNTLRGTQAIYVFREFETGRLIPIRWLEIRKVRVHGNIYYISYRVKSYVNYDSDPERRRLKIKHFNEQFFEKHNKDLRETAGGEHMKPLVLSTTMEFDLGRNAEASGPYVDREDADWKYTVDEIGRHSTFENYPFIRITAVERSGRSFSEDDANSTEISRTGDTYSISPKFVYGIKIICYVPHTSTGFYGTDEAEAPRTEAYLPAGGVHFSLKANPLHIVPLREEAIADGQYDITTLRFRAVRPRVPVDTMLYVSSWVSSNERKRTFYTLELPVHIPVGPQARVVRIALLVAFVALYFGAGFVSSFGFGLPESFISDLAIVATAISATFVLKDIGALLDEPRGR